MGSTSAKPTHIRWLVLSLVGTTSWLLYLHRYAWGVVKPKFAKDYAQERDIEKIPAADMGLLDSAFMITYAVGQVPLGLLGDRVGPRKVLYLLIALWSLALAALSQVHEFGPVFLTLATFGLMQAGAYPLISKVTRTWFPREYRTTVQGLVTSLGRIGAACAPVLVATVLLGELHFSWRQALAVIAVPGLALAAAVLLFLRDSPRQHPWTNDAERALLMQADAANPSTLQPLVLDRAPATLFSFGMVLFYAFASTFADMLYVFWIPTFLSEEKHLSDQAMGMFTPLPLLGGAVGGFLGGMLNDLLIRRLGNRRWGRSLVAMTGKTLAACFIAVSVSIVDGRLVMVFLLACKFFGDWSLPTQWGTITDMAGRSAATVFGVVNTVGAVGGMLASPIMGRIKDVYGWDTLFYFVGAIYLSAALAWLFIDCTKPLVKSQP